MSFWEGWCLAVFVVPSIYCLAWLVEGIANHEKEWAEQQWRRRE